VHTEEKHMSQMSQGDAVMQCVRGVMGEQAKYVWDEIGQKDREAIVDAMFALYKAGSWSVKSANLDTDEKVRKYIPGMVNNWVRKHKELNGGEKYEIKKPGSRAGSGNGGDEQLTAMKGLRALLVSQKLDTSEVDKAIKVRQEELERAKVKAINVNALPEHLRHLVPSK
jgi:hypothetical protein